MHTEDARSGDLRAGILVIGDVRGRQGRGTMITLSK